jgi:hypothetical protein
MTTKQLIGTALTIIAVLLAMLLVETYRRCTDFGYTDCPRLGAHIWPHQRKTPAPE